MLGKTPVVGKIKQPNQPLPDALQPWHQWLTWFAPELIPAIAEMLVRLNGVVGPFRGNMLGGTPEQDGLGNIQRKGDYQQLLLSEWLLADEFPDEFLRKAANSEHLFLAPNYRRQQVKNLIVVLFDTGPLQLGSCRLAHIAMLILLARRAEQVDGKLLWGVMQPLTKTTLEWQQNRKQDPNNWQQELTSQSVVKLTDDESIEVPTELCEFTGPEHLRQLLNLRCFQPVTKTRSQQWQQKLDQLADDMGECWLVGAESSVSLWPAKKISHQVIIQPSIKESCLDVRMIDRGRGRCVALPLPRLPIAKRLLKGQFNVQVTQQNNIKHRISIIYPPVISFHGHSVSVTLLDKPAILLFKIPKLNRSNKVSKTICQPYPANSQIFTRYSKGKKFGALMAQKDRLIFWQSGELTSLVKPSTNDFNATTGTAKFIPSAIISNGRESKLFVLDMANQLLHFSIKEPELDTKLSLVCKGVLGLTKMRDNQIAYICFHNGVLHQVITGVEMRCRYFSLDYVVPLKTKVLISFLTDSSNGYPCAIQMQGYLSESWRIYNLSINDAVSEVSLPLGWKAIGLYYAKNITQDQDPYLLLINQNKKNIAYYHLGKLKTCYSAPSTIVKFTFCSIWGLLAMLTEDKELIVYSVYEESLRLFSQAKDRGLDE